MTALQLVSTGKLRLVKEVSSCGSPLNAVNHYWLITSVITY